MLMFLGVTLHSFVLHNPYVTQLCYGYFYGKCAPIRFSSLMYGFV